MPSEVPEMRRSSAFFAAELKIPDAIKGNGAEAWPQQAWIFVRMKHGGAASSRTGGLLKNQCSHAHYPRQTQRPLGTPDFFSIG
jgi:hypothetical protein